jgi:hypothetical protein
MPQPADITAKNTFTSPMMQSPEIIDANRVPTYAASLTRTAKSMSRDVLDVVRHPKQALAPVLSESKAIYGLLKTDQHYWHNLRGRWCNQVGGGLSQSGFIALLGHTGAATAASGLLMSGAIRYFEDRVASVINLHRGIIRDSAKKAHSHNGAPLTPEQQLQRNAELLLQQRNAAGRLLLLGGLDAAVMSSALGVVYCVSAGFIGGTGLILALAGLQTARTCLIIYQYAYLDMLKVTLPNADAHQVVNSDWVQTINTAEAGVGQLIYSTTVIVCQATSFFMPAPYLLPFTAAQIFLGIGLSASGKFQYLPLLAANNATVIAPGKRAD